MKNVYRSIEMLFEKLSMLVTRILGNSITFLLALVLVIIYFSDAKVYEQPRSTIIMNVIFAITFLSLFIIQKTMNHFSKALHIKMNELVASHGDASNLLINVEDKTEEELHELSKHFSKLAKDAQTSNQKGSQSIEKILKEEAANS